MGSEGTIAPIPPDMMDAVEVAHQAIVEAAAETNDDLIMKYLEGEELTTEEVRDGLHLSVLNGAITPVYCGTALGDIGLERLLPALTRYVPAPNERSLIATQDGEIAITR